MNLKFIILGCGSSLGVPRIDGNYGDCDPKNPKNFRTRCCALIKSKNKNVFRKIKIFRYDRFNKFTNQKR